LPFAARLAHAARARALGLRALSPGDGDRLRRAVSCLRRAAHAARADGVALTRGGPLLAVPPALPLSGAAFGLRSGPRRRRLPGRGSWAQSDKPSPPGGWRAARP